MFVAVIDLIRECPNLRELDVSGCDGVTDSSLEYLHHYSTTLVHCPMELDIGGNFGEFRFPSSTVYFTSKVMLFVMFC
mgnify:CR=1 FL=1